MLARLRTRTLLVMLLISLLLEGGMIFAFSRIPYAQAYIPLSVARSPDAYDWSPDEAPRWYHTDDPNLEEANYFRSQAGLQLNSGDGTFDDYLSIMDWVRAQSVIEDASVIIEGDPITVLTAMQDGVPAQCGNFAAIFAATSASAGYVDVRIWHLLGDDGPGAQGHIANEVWVPESEQWVFVDPMNNTYVLLDGQPASILDVREMLLTGQQDRLQLVVGPNTHTPPDAIFDLYAGAMVVPSMQGSTTPLSSSYALTGLDRLIARLPDVGGLPYLADRFVALLTGEARQVILIDALAQQHTAPLPITQTKLLLIAIVVGLAWIGFLTLALVGRLLARRRTHGRDRSRMPVEAPISR